jgi:hypothetical protein
VAVPFLLFVAATSRAQEAPRDRIVTAIRDADVRHLQGNVHPEARAQFDRGQVADSTLLPRVTLFFTPSPGQHAALRQLLAEQQDRSSPNYHRWITPDEFGARFGLTQNDLNKVISWLESRGFAVQEVPASRNAVIFSGSAQQVGAGFQTSIHHYVRNGEQHYANASEPTIPAALAGIVSGFAGLNDFAPKPNRIIRSVPGPTPSFDTGSGGHFLAPADFGMIYDVQPLYNRGIDGTGQKIVVVGQSDIQLSDIAQFRSLLGLPAKSPQVVLVPGAGDPGMKDRDLQEAELDLEWAGAVARNATLIYVNSTNAWESLQYAVKNNLAPVISVSYARCEPEFSASDVQFFILLGEQANAQGQTIVVSSGDSGAAACDALFAPQAQKGPAINMPASLPYVTAVGGTEFNEGSGAYWSTANNTANGSALSYIPEVTWNDSYAGSGIQATGGGPSTLFTKPSWQFGPGVPSDGVRDIPDISFSASAVHDAYLICDETFNSTTKTFTPVCPNGYFGGFGAVGGTSVSAPAFAGLVALLNQSMNSPQGNINRTLYSLASLSPNPLHDITSGSNAVPCQTNPPGSACPASGSMGYSAGPGYDMATGLGSVDANILISGWASVPLSPDFDISVSPARITLNRGSVATAEITVNGVGGMRGVPSFACSVPAIFLGVTCSIASAGPNTFTLTLATSNGAAALTPSAIPGTGPQVAARTAARSSERLGAGSYPLAPFLVFGSIVIFWCASQAASGRAKLVSLLAAACSVVALLGCAGATSGGGSGSPQAQAASVSIQVTPQNAFLGANGQLQFTAIVANSVDTSVNWSVSPALGSITGSVKSGRLAVGVYAAPSAFSANQSVTLTATSIADPSKQASANILLVPSESGAIQVTEHERSEPHGGNFAECDLSGGIPRS